MIKNAATSIALALLVAVLFAVSGASPARADRCDDLAAQLKNQIDGLTVGKTAANVIYLSHPQAKRMTLGCASREFSNQLYAVSDGRKPKPAFFDLVASAAAIHPALPARADERAPATRHLTITAATELGGYTDTDHVSVASPGVSASVADEIEGWSASGASGDILSKRRTTSYRVSCHL